MIFASFFKRRLPHKGKKSPPQIASKRQKKVFYLFLEGTKGDVVQRFLLC